MNLRLVLRKIARKILNKYWNVFHVPVVVNLLFDDNYTRLNWDDYFLFKKKNIKSGYVKYSRNEFLKFATPDEQAWGEIDALTMRSYRDYPYNNINLWEVCRASILSDLNNYQLEIITESDLSLVKKYFKEATLYMGAMKNIISRKNISAILITQGTTYASRCVLEIAQRLKITTVAIENSFAGDRFFADNSSGIILNRHAMCMQIWSRASSRVLTCNQKKKLHDEIEKLYKKKGPEHLTNNTHGINYVKEKFNIKVNRKIALLLGQVNSDASIIMDSTVFANVVDYIKTTINYFEQSDNEWYLIVRLHPYEAYGINNSSLSGQFKKHDNLTYKTLVAHGYVGSQNYCLLEGQDYATDELIKGAELCMTINSQAGLEALLMGKPLVTAGRAIYSGKGYTIDVPVRELYFQVLDYALKNPNLSSLQNSEIEKFAYTLLFEYTFPKDLEKIGGRFDSLLKKNQGYVDVIDQEQRCLDGY